MNRTYIRTAADVRMNRGNYIVGSVSAAGVSMTATPCVHLTAVDAERECARLANLHPEKTFVYFKIAGGAVAQQVVKF